MPYHDLHVPYTPNHAALSNTLAFHAELGYTTIAISLSITGKLPSTPQPIPLTLLKPPNSITRLLTRLTLTISDTTNNHRLTQFSPAYDILALRPTNEKALQLCCTSLDSDLISLDLSQRLGYPLKFKTVSSALQRGIRFEICYGPAIQASGNSEARRNLISNATQLIRATRGKGIVLSSEAEDALGVRGPHDVMNLAHIWGLGQERGKEALCDESAKVVRLAGIKRTSFRGVIDIIDDGGGEQEEESKIEQGSAAAAKTKGTAPTHGLKRKASTTSLSTPTSTPAQNPTDDKPLSNRELKRRAKKARLEARLNGTQDQEETSKDTEANPDNSLKVPVSDFAIQHETLSSKSPR